MDAVPLRVRDPARREDEPRPPGGLHGDEECRRDPHDGVRHREIEPVGHTRRPDLAKRLRDDAGVLADAHCDRERGQPPVRSHDSLPSWAEPSAADASRASFTSFAGSRTRPVKPSPATRVREATSRSSASSSSRREAVRLGHEDGELAGIEDVGVERDVDGIGAVERPIHRLLAGLHARRRDELHLGWVEVARADQRDVAADRRRRRRSPSAAASPTRSRTARTAACSGRRGRRARRPRGTPRSPRAPRSHRRASSSSRRARSDGRGARRRAGGSAPRACRPRSRSPPDRAAPGAPPRPSSRRRRPRRAGHGRARRGTPARTSGTGTRGRRRPRSACGSRDSGRAGGSPGQPTPARPLEEDRVAVDAHARALVQPRRTRGARCVDAESPAR